MYSIVNRQLTKNTHTHTVDCKARQCDPWMNEWMRLFQSCNILQTVYMKTSNQINCFFSSSISRIFILILFAVIRNNWLMSTQWQMPNSYFASLFLFIHHCTTFKNKKCMAFLINICCTLQQCSSASTWFYAKPFELLLLHATVNHFNWIFKKKNN